MKPSRMILLLLALLAPLLIAGAVVAFQNYRRVAEEFHRQESRLQELREEHVALEEAIRRLSSPVGIEMEARARLNMIREGERMVILTPPQDSPTPAPLEETKPSLLEKILQWLGGQ